MAVALADLWFDILFNACLADVSYDEKKEKDAEWSAKVSALEKIEEFKKKKKRECVGLQEDDSRSLCHG